MVAMPPTPMLTVRHTSSLLYASTNPVAGLRKWYDLVTLTNLLYWSMVESGLALIASCLPTLRLNTLPSALSQLAFNVRESLVPTSRSDTSISKASGNRSTSNQKGMSKTHKWIPASHPGMAPSFRSDSSSQCSPLMDMPLPELPPAHKGTFYLEP